MSSIKVKPDSNRYAPPRKKRRLQEDETAENEFAGTEIPVIKVEMDDAIEEDNRNLQGKKDFRSQEETEMPVVKLEVDYSSEEDNINVQDTKESDLPLQEGGKWPVVKLHKLKLEEVGFRSVQDGKEEELLEEQECEEFVIEVSKAAEVTDEEDSGNEAMASDNARVSRSNKNGHVPFTYCWRSEQDEDSGEDTGEVMPSKFDSDESSEFESNTAFNSCTLSQRKQNSKYRQRVGRQQQKRSKPAGNQSRSMRKAIQQNEPQADKRIASKIVVKTTSNGDKRRYDKQYICYFCDRPKFKLPLHFRQAHSDEPAVIDWLEEADQRLKSAKLTKLRNLGNHIQNCRVLEKGQGELLVKYRPKIYADPTSFVPCPNCYGYFARKGLWSHACPLENKMDKKKGNVQKRGKRVHQGIMLLPSSMSSESQVQRLLCTLRNDDVSQCIKSDDLIIKLATKEIQGLDSDKKQLQNQERAVKAKLRLVGKFLVEVRLVSNNPDSSLSDFIDPARYECVLTAVRNLAEFNSKTMVFSKPQIALKIGYAMKKCAMIVKAEGVKCGSEDMVRQSTEFLEILEMKWTEDFACHNVLAVTEITENYPESSCGFEHPSQLRDSVEQVANRDEACMTQEKSRPCASKTKQNNNTPVEMVPERPYPVSISKVTSLVKERKLSAKPSVSVTEALGSTDVERDQMEWSVLSADFATHSPGSNSITLARKYSNYIKERIDIQEKEQTHKLVEQSCAIEQEMNEPEKTETNNSVISKVTVKTTSNGIHRKYDKQYMCCFCKNFKCKLPSHFRRVHSDEPAVIDWLEEENLRLKSAKLAKLRNLGNHFKNCRVLSQGKGELLVRYRPTKNADPTKFVYCPKCYGYFCRKSVKSHTCPLEEVTHGDKGKQRARPKQAKNDSKVKEILGTMKMGDVSWCIESDDLILALAKERVEIIGQNHLRKELRKIGRFLMEVRMVSNKPDGSLSDFLHPERYASVLTAVRNLAGFDCKTQMFLKPKLALEIGYGIKKCAMIVKVGLESGSPEMLRQSTKFLELLEMKWTEDFACKSLDTTTESTKTNLESICNVVDFCHLQDSVDQMTNGEGACMEKGNTLPSTSQINKLEATQTQMISDRLFPVSIFKVANLDEEEKLLTKRFANNTSELGKTEFELDSEQKGILPTDVSTHHSVSLQQIVPTEQITQKEQRVDRRQEETLQPPGELFHPEEELVEPEQSQASGRVVSQITVKTTSNDERRKYDKQFVCYFCNKPKCKLPSHFRRLHSEEPAVIDWLEEKDHRLKSAKLTKLRNLGNHIQNCRVLEKGQGELLVRYRPNIRVDPTNFVPCPHCYGYFARRSLWSHTCPLDEGTSKAKGARKLRSERVKNGTMLLPSRNSASEVEELFNGMKTDDVSNCIKGDNLILSLARKEMVEQGKEQYSHVRIKLRQIGRFLLEARSVSNEPYRNLSDFIDPERYNSVVATIKNLAGFNVKTRSSKLPSLPVKIGHGLRKCALVLKAEGIKSGDEITVKKATKFHEILEMRWNKDFACRSLDTVTESTKTNPENLCDDDCFSNLQDGDEQVINEDEACMTDGETLLGTTQINQLNAENLCDINDFSKIQDSVEQVISEEEACNTEGRTFLGTTQINQLDTTPTQTISDSQFPVSISKAANIDGEKKLSTKHLSNYTDVHGITELGLDSVQRSILSTSISPHPVSLHQVSPTKQNSQRKQRVRRRQEEQSQSAEELTYPGEEMIEQKQLQENSKGASQITVKTTSNDEGRKYDKQYICYFCEEPKCKLPSHFRRVHSGEPEVIDWLEEKDQRLKSAKLTKLRNLGNHIQNCRVLEKGQGELLVRYRPNIRVDPTNFVPCPHCYGYFVRTNLWSHTCPLDIVTSKAKGKGKPKSKRVKNGTMLLPSSRSSESKVEELLNGMKNDDVSNCVKNDALILALARKEVKVVEQDRDQHNYLRVKLRQIGRFLLEARSVSNEPYSKLSDFIDPERYNSVVATIKNLAGFNVKTRSSKLPSLPVKIGHGLRKCALVLKAEGIKSGDEITVKKATKFHEILEMRWNKDFACRSLDTVTESTKTNPENLCDDDCFSNLQDGDEQVINEDEACMTDGETLLGTTQINQLNAENLCDINDFSKIQDSVEQVISEEEACNTEGRTFLGTTQINQLDTTPTQTISDSQFPVSISKAANIDGEKKLSTKHLSNYTDVHGITELGLDSVQRSILSTSISPHPVSLHQVSPTKQNSQRKQRVRRRQEEQSQSAEELTYPGEEMIEQKQLQENSKGASQITVKTTSNDEGRKYDKQYICYFCEEPKCKLPSHFRRVHSGELEVIDWLEEKDQRLKSAKLTKLRNLGNHIQNCRVLEKGQGELLVRYRPNIRVDPTNFVPCPHCYGYFVRTNLWSHTCPLDIVTSKAKGKGKPKSKRVKNGTMLLPSSRSSESKVEELLNGMKNDDVSNCVKNDALILALARKEVKVVEQDRDQHNYLRVKLRQIGRFLLEARSVSNEPYSKLSDFIDPERYDSVVATVQSLSGFNVKTRSSKLPSLPVKIGHGLRKCALVLKAEGIKSGDEITVKKATKFHEILETRWNQDTAFHALHASGEQKDEALSDKPSTDYVTSEQSHINEEIIEREEEVNVFVEECEPFSLWIDPNGAALLQELLSNRLDLN